MKCTVAVATDQVGLRVVFTTDRTLLAIGALPGGSFQDAFEQCFIAVETFGMTRCATHRACDQLIVTLATYHTILVGEFAFANGSTGAWFV